LYADYLLTAPACCSSGDAGSQRNAVEPSANSAAMVAINDQDSGVCFRMNGGAYVYTHNSGIFINCDSSFFGLNPGFFEMQVFDIWNTACPIHYHIHTEALGF
jgi:hypothetical protein